MEFTETQRYKVCQTIFGDFSKSNFYFSKNTISLYDLIGYIIFFEKQKTKLNISTFSIDAKAVAFLAYMQQFNYITECNLIASHYTKKSKISRFAKNFINLYYTSIHAKIACFEFENGNVYTIISSCNLQKSKNFEFFNVFTDFEMFNYYNSELIKLMSKCSPLKV